MNVVFRLAELAHCPKLHAITLPCQEALADTSISSMVQLTHFAPRRPTYFIFFLYLIVNLFFSLLYRGIVGSGSAVAILVQRTTI
jgi:hypothetical protein